MDAVSGLVVDEVAGRTGKFKGGVYGFDGAVVYGGFEVEL